MSQNSINLALPYIQGGQAQKHVTHNEAIRTLDAVVQLSIKDQVLAPDGTEAEGDRYIVAPAATGVFEGHETQIAVLETGVWSFLTPRTGWVAFDVASSQQVGFDGTDWIALSGAASSIPTSIERLGINAGADTTNRLVVASDATLFTNDVSGGHQLKVNKQTATETASLLFQTGFSGRAEMGTAGNDDFEIKVSPDGATFFTALHLDRDTGAVTMPNTNLSQPEFGSSPLVTQSYAVARGANMIANSTGFLGNSYNYPPSFTFDAAVTPSLSGAFSKSGHYSGADEMEEFVAVDPNRLYRLRSYLRQESADGDWSGFANADRHLHHLGFRCYDADGLTIDAAHHMRYRHAGTDSLTSLASPLAPGDTIVDLVNASGWNEATDASFERGLVIFGYQNASGTRYDHYSRIEEIDLFDLGGVDKTNNQITLNQPLPAALGNPDDPDGIWPVGTRIANRASGWNYKFGFFGDLVLDAADTWYQIENAIGGIDLSGRNIANNFPPGTAFARPVFLMNYSNRMGGYDAYPDTGANQRVWISGLSVDADPSGAVNRNTEGSCDLHIVEGDPVTGNLSFALASMKISAL